MTQARKPALTAIVLGTQYARSVSLTLVIRLPALEYLPGPRLHDHFYRIPLMSTLNQILLRSRANVGSCGKTIQDLEEEKSEKRKQAVKDTEVSINFYRQSKTSFPSSSTSRLLNHIIEACKAAQSYHPQRVWLLPSSCFYRRPFPMISEPLSSRNDGRLRRISHLRQELPDLECWRIS